MKRTFATLACVAAIASLASCADKSSTGQAGAAQLPAVSRLAAVQKLDPDAILSPALAADQVKMANPLANCDKQDLCGLGTPTGIELARLTDASGKLTAGALKDQLVEVLSWTGMDCSQVLQGPSGDNTYKSTCTRRVVVDASTGEIEGIWNGTS